MISLVYLTQPAEDYTSLRYSLRSMAKHLKGAGHLVIVGEKPDFVKNCLHIPAADPHRGNRARNIFEKILKAAMHKKVSDQFICASDDHFLLRDHEASAFPYYYCNMLEEAIARINPANYYRLHLKSTYEALMARDLPTVNFNVHAPVLYEKEKFVRVMTGYDWSISKGYVSKSLYCNTLKLDGLRERDHKFHTPRSSAAIHRHTNDAPFFSTNDASLDDAMKGVLQEWFPDPSPWEKSLVKKRLASTCSV